MITHMPVWGQQPTAYRHGDSTLRTVPLRVLPPERSVGGGGVEGELLESRGVGGRLMRLGVVQWWFWWVLWWFASAADAIRSRLLPFLR